jgi:hypothetical protein
MSFTCHNFIDEALYDDLKEKIADLVFSLLSLLCTVEYEDKPAIRPEF